MYTDNDIKKELSINIKNARINANLTQDDLAEKVNLSVQFIRDIERGDSIGSVTTLLNIFNVLNITPNEIFSKLLNVDLSSNKGIIEKINSLNEHDKNVILLLIKEINNI